MLPRARARPMVKLFTAPYFDEFVKVLNNSDDFKAKTANVNVTVLMVNKDDKSSFLLTLTKGTAAYVPGSEDTKADFTFIGDYATWVANHKGEAPLEKLVMTGKLKFKGSIPKIMSMRSQLVVIDNLAQTIEAEL